MQLEIADMEESKVEVNNFSKEMKKSVKIRLLTAFFMFLIGAPCVILGGWFFVAFIALATVCMTYEFINVAIHQKLSWYVYVLIYVMMLSFVFWIFTDASKSDGIVHFESNFLDGIGMSDIRVSTLGLAFFVGFMFLFALLSSKIDVVQVCYIITMTIFISISLQSVMFLRFCPQYLYNQQIAPSIKGELFKYNNHFEQCLLIIFVAGGALINDAYAFFVGILFGKHKLNPRISPKKTWEGFIGGVILTAITGFIFSIVCDICNVPLIKGILDIEHWYFCLLFSIIIPVVSVLGDFMFSAIKRYFNVKDFGKIFPGHGGFLDRFDSVLITSLICSVLIILIAYNPLMKVVF